VLILPCLSFPYPFLFLSFYLLFRFLPISSSFVFFLAWITAGVGLESRSVGGLEDWFSRSRRGGGILSRVLGLAWLGWAGLGWAGLVVW